MSNRIPIYTAEAEIADQIKNNSSISYASQIVSNIDEKLEQSLLADKIPQCLKDEYKSIAKVDDFDLHICSAILASSNCNKNDDLFLKEELYAARFTPSHKPFNYMHDETDVIGHIIANSLVDADYNLLSDDVKVDELPELFHILTHAVLYKNWSDDELQERMNNIISTLANRYVSMEARFPNFDYGLEKGENKFEIIQRTEATAHMTKFLRIFGGTGVYNDKKIARVLRSITFAGKGLVDNPANQYSVIVNANTKSKVLTTEKIMADETRDLLQKQNTEQKDTIDKLTAQVSDLQKQLSDNSAEALKSEIQKLSDTADAKDTVIDELKTELDNIKTQLSDANTKLEESENKASELQEKFDKMEAKHRQESRIAEIVKLGKSDDEAKTLAEKFEKLDDDTFSSMVDTLKSIARVEDNDDVESDDAEASASDTTLEDAEAESDSDLTGGQTDAEEDDAMKLRTTLASFVENKFLHRKTEEVQ